MSNVPIEDLIDFDMADQLAKPVPLPINLQNLTFMCSINSSEADHSSASIDAHNLAAHEETVPNAESMDRRYREQRRTDCNGRN